MERRRGNEGYTEDEKEEAKKEIDVNSNKKVEWTKASFDDYERYLTTKNL